jgi:hypothetical protein
MLRASRAQRRFAPFTDPRVMSDTARLLATGRRVLEFIVADALWRLEWRLLEVHADKSIP